MVQVLSFKTGCICLSRWITFKSYRKQTYTLSHTGSATAIFSFSLTLVHVPAEFNALWSIGHAILVDW